MSGQVQKLAKRSTQPEVDGIQGLAKPFLRWAGSKRQLIPRLQAAMPKDYDGYMEPFVGSGQLFFSLQGAKRTSTISDANSDLIATYQAIQSNPSKVWSYLMSFPLTKSFYLWARTNLSTSASVYKRAALFIYLNRYSFNGLYRTNASGQFNVPYNNRKNGELPDKSHIVACSKALRNVTIECSDFDIVVRKHIRPGYLVYLDPPYARVNDRLHKQYGPHTFGHSDIDRLTALLEYIDSNDAFFMLSYAKCSEVRHLGTWETKEVVTRRNIAGFAGARRMAKEIIFMNYCAT